MTETSKPGPRTRASQAGRLIKPKPVATVEAPAEHTGVSLPAEAPAGPAHQPRFHFFLIDSGWDGPVPSMIRKNLDMITQLQNADPIFVLSREQSNQLILKHPHLVGKDPILLARDLKAGECGGCEYHGFHLNLGLLRDPNRALEVLKTFLNFLATHRQSTDIEQCIRAQLHRDGLQGAIEVLRVGSEAAVGG